MNPRLRIVPGDVACFSLDHRESEPKPMLISHMTQFANGATDVGFIDGGTARLDSIVTLDVSAWQFRKLL